MDDETYAAELKEFFASELGVLMSIWGSNEKKQKQREQEREIR